MEGLRNAVKKISQTANRSICGGLSLDIPSALDAVSQAYGQFLLDPGAAFQPQVVAIRHFDLIINLQKAARNDAQALVGTHTSPALLSI